MQKLICKIFIKFSIFFLGLIFTNTSFSAILEKHSLHEIRPLIDDDTLVVFDIDNTLLKPTQSLGSDEWYIHTYAKYLKQGFSDKKAKIKAKAEWKQINLATPVLPVEPHTAQFILDLQNKHIKTMALTARPTDNYQFTKKQLASQNIDFTFGNLLPTDSKKLAKNALYKDGIIFSDDHNKGQILLNFIKEFKLNPKSIVFVDDVPKNAKRVDEALSKANINVKSIRYGALDEQVHAFDAHITDLQMQIFLNQRKLISDEQAASLLKI